MGEALATSSSADAGLAVAVVRSPFLRIAQDLVCLGDLLELGLCLWRRVPVGMVFHRQFPIGLLDLGFGSVPGNPEQGVECAHASNPSTRRLVCSTRPMILSYC